MGLFYFNKTTIISRSVCKQATDLGKYGLFTLLQNTFGVIVQKRAYIHKYLSLIIIQPFETMTYAISNCAGTLFG